jgi:hypothetical protein
VMLVPLEGGEPRWPLDEPLLALPDAENANYTLFVNESGQWLLEGPNETRALQHGDIVVVNEARWRFSCPKDVSRTVTAPWASGLGYVREIEMAFGVSGDEETVQLSLSCAGQVRDLGSKVCYYLLLTLARCRLGQGVPKSMRVDSQGWVDVASLGELLRMTEQRLNVDIFRVRRIAAEFGVLDANGIIERRGHPRSVRLGTDRVTISTPG